MRPTTPSWTTSRPRGRALNHERRIDRDAVYALKRAALERLWRRFPGDAAFEQFVTDGGDDLAGVRDVLRLGRASRNRMAKLAGRASVSRTRRGRGVRRDVMRTGSASTPGCNG